MMQKYSKFSLFFQVQRLLQTFAKALRCFTTCYGSRLQHFIYRSPTCSSRHAAPSTAPSAHNTPQASPQSPSERGCPSGRGSQLPSQVNSLQAVSFSPPHIHSGIPTTIGLPSPPVKHMFFSLFYLSYLSYKSHFVSTLAR